MIFNIPIRLIWLIFLIVSFFYCLPLGRFSILGFTTDFRVFDFSIFVFWLFNWNRLKNGMAYLFKDRKWASYYVYIILFIILFSIIFSLINRGTNYLGPTLIRAYRFVGYWIMLHVILISVKDYRDYRTVLRAFYFSIVAITLIAFLQAFNVIPNFWPEYWREMYKTSPAPVATLSPHHLQISLVMLMGLCLTLAFFQSSKNLILKVMLSVIGFMMLLIPIFAGTRTFFLAIPGILFGITLFQRLKVVYSLVAVVLGVVAYLILANTNLESRTFEMVNERYEERFLREYEEGGVEELAMERTVVYESIFKAILNNPEILITGSGFQAAAVFIYGTGAHNNFLQFLVETGIIGLLFFLIFLWTASKNLYRSSQYFKNKVGTYSGYIFAGFLGLILTMITSETMYAQAAMFTLPAQIMIFLGLGISPYFRLYLLKKRQIGNSKRILRNPQ